MELDNGDTVHVKTPVGMRIPPPSADESITVAQNGIVSLQK
jgi:hypothetical protein